MALPMNRSFRTKSRHGYSVKFSPYYPHRLACASSQYYGIAGCGSLYVLDVTDTGVLPFIVFDWGDSLFDVAWAENNENVLVSCSGDGSIQVWDTLQPKGPLKVFKEHKKEVNAVDWSQTRNEHFVLSASWDNLIKLWDVTRDSSLETFQGHQHIVYNACWSPQVPGLFISVSGDYTLRMWDVRRPESCVSLVTAHNAEVLSCDWCKYDQNLVYTSGVDGLIKMWDLRNSRLPTCELRGHKYAVRRLRASPYQGAVVASASYDFSVKIWDTLHQTCVNTIEHHSEFVYGLDFNLHIPKQMADCAWDELVHVYETPLHSPPAAPVL